jgi:hypothetical protein
MVQPRHDAPDLPGSRDQQRDRPDRDMELVRATFAKEFRALRRVDGYAGALTVTAARPGLRITWLNAAAACPLGTPMPFGQHLVHRGVVQTGALSELPGRLRLGPCGTCAGPAGGPVLVRWRARGPARARPGSRSQERCAAASPSWSASGHEERRSATLTSARADTRWPAGVHADTRSDAGLRSLRALKGWELSQGLRATSVVTVPLAVPQPARWRAVAARTGGAGVPLIRRRDGSCIRCL